MSFDFSKPFTYMGLSARYVETLGSGIHIIVVGKGLNEAVGVVHPDNEGQLQHVPAPWEPPQFVVGQRWTRFPRAPRRVVHVKQQPGNHTLIFVEVDAGLQVIHPEDFEGWELQYPGPVVDLAKTFYELEDELKVHSEPPGADDYNTLAAEVGYLLKYFGVDR